MNKSKIKITRPGTSTGEEQSDREKEKKKERVNERMSWKKSNAMHLEKVYFSERKSVKIVV